MLHLCKAVNDLRKELEKHTHNFNNKNEISNHINPLISNFATIFKD